MDTLRVFAGRLLIASIVLVAQTTRVDAYSQYSQNRDATNCGACHGDFNSGSYVSSHDGVAWGTHLMAGHNAMMSSDCSACHQSSGRFPVLTNSSAGGVLGFSTSGCVGCHGRGGDAGHGAADGRGAGLRQHHDRSGIHACRTCHADANTTTPTYTPVAESAMPFNYFTPDANHVNKPTDSCDANGTESRHGTTGLDNDGNGLYDSADPACSIVTTSTTTTPAVARDDLDHHHARRWQRRPRRHDVGGSSTTTTTTLEGGTTTTTTLPDVDSDADDDGLSDADGPAATRGVTTSRSSRGSCSNDSTRSRTTRITDQGRIRHGERVRESRDGWAPRDRRAQRRHAVVRHSISGR
jgi:hypothetical protein